MVITVTIVSFTFTTPQESVAGTAPIASDVGTSTAETRKRKRAGKKKSGAQKKREKMSREEGPGPLGP